MPRQTPSPSASKFLILVVALLLTPGLGMTPSRAEGTPSTSVLNERIDIHLREAAAEEVMKMFGQIFEAEVDLDPGVQGAVTITLNNVTVRTALTATCESLGCQWRFLPAEPARLIIEPQPQPQRAQPGAEAPLTLELDHVTARDAFEAIARISGLHIILEPGVEGELSVSLTDRKVGEVLDQLCRQLDCRWKMTVESEGTWLRVAPR